MSCGFGLGAGPRRVLGRPCGPCSVAEAGGLAAGAQRLALPLGPPGPSSSQREGVGGFGFSRSGNSKQKQWP